MPIGMPRQQRPAESSQRSNVVSPGRPLSALLVCMSTRRKQECNTMTSNATCLSHRHYCYQARVGARKALHWSHWAQLACACMSMAPSDPCSQLSQRKHLLGSGSSLPWDHKRLAPLEIEMCIDESRVVRLMDPLVSIPVVNK